jgi:hypothetical protein
MSFKSHASLKGYIWIEEVKVHHLAVLKFNRANHNF